MTEECDMLLLKEYSIQFFQMFQSSLTTNFIDTVADDFSFDLLKRREIFIIKSFQKACPNRKYTNTYIWVNDRSSLHKAKL